MAALAAGFFIAALAVLHIFALYAILLVVLARFHGPEVRHRRGASNPPSIGVIVVAHDEERVVADSVRSLVAQRYPAELFAVCVVADHCSDRTSAVAREAGARVFERTSGRAEGKSAAVGFGIDAALRSARFDAIAIFDADNHVDPEFLAQVGARLEAGERVVQGFVDVKNPVASWVAASSALGFWGIAGVAQEPRERLGLSAPLMGTGFALEAALARRFLVSASSLTDDLDLGARLALERIRVAYEPTARTFDEKPVALRTAVEQRHRWMQGRWTVAGRHAPALVREALLGRGTALERARSFDVAVQLVHPSLLFTAVAIAVLTAVLVLFQRVSGNAWAFPALPSFGAAAVYYTLPALTIAKFHPPARAWLVYLLQPVYLVLSVPLAASGWLTRHGKTWARTPKGVE